MNVPIDAYPNLTAFRDRMAARPKVQEDDGAAEGLIQ